MINIDFKDLVTNADIAREFGCSESFISTVISKPSVCYERNTIPKKGRHKQGQYRTVYEVVDDELKILQKNIATVINSKVSFRDYVQGFVNKRSIATNASLHLAQKYVLNVDIKDFFDTIKKSQVAEAFKNLGCIQDIAEIFASLCTLNGSLIQGTSTSPVLANLVCAEFDESLAELATQYSCSYSRYADDITFSGEKIPPKKKIKQCLTQYGFTLNPDKYKNQSRGGPQYVTGLTVVDKRKPRVSKNLKRRLRQIIYYASKYGLESHLDKIGCSDKRSQIYRLDGLIAFMYSIELERALELDIEWQKIINKYSHSEGDRIVSCRNPHEIYQRFVSSHENS
jgi:RNA-directed DNA polymerase